MHHCTNFIAARCRRQMTNLAEDKCDHLVSRVRGQPCGGQPATHSSRGSICQSCRLNWPYPFSYCPKGQTSCFHHGKCHPKQHSTQIFFEIQSNPSNMRGSVRDDQEPSGLVLHPLTRAIEFLCSSFVEFFFSFLFFDGDCGVLKDKSLPSLFSVH